MRVNTPQDVMQSTVQPVATSETPQASFLAALETAKQNLVLSPEKLPQAESTGNKGQPAPTATKTALQELDEYLRKSPIQRMREAILKKMGLTEEDLAAMPPEQRAAIEETIAAKIKEYLLGHNDDKQNSAQHPVSI